MELSIIIFRYLKGTADHGLYYPYNTNNTLIGYADAGYLSDTDNAKSQTGYVFMVGETAISWKSVKQTLTATSTYHAEILAIHEASRECIWLRSLIDHIYSKCGLPIFSNPTDLYEDNEAVVSQIIKGFIKGEKIKHIAPKFFFTHEQHGKTINVKKISSQENHADLFTKSLTPTIHRYHCEKIGIRSLQKLQQEEPTVHTNERTKDYTLFPF